jgi:hypothetical protein
MYSRIESFLAGFLARQREDRLHREPILPLAPTLADYFSAIEELPGKIAEIDACATTQRVPAPDPWINIEQL